MTSGDPAPSWLRLLIGQAAIRLDRGLLAAAERCWQWPRVGSALLYVGEQCGRLARRMLTER